MFKVRFLSGVVLVVLAVAILYLGGYVTGAAVMLLAFGGVYEIMRVYRQEKSAVAIVNYIFTFALYTLIALEKTEYEMPLIILFVLVELGVYVLTFPRFKDCNVFAAIGSFFYVSLMISYMYRIRLLEHGGAFVVMIFICSWINDTCAYLVGVKFGKHKMSPKLSPKKSVEGLIGGIAGACIVSILYGIFIDTYVYALENAALIFGVMGALGACAAVIGDLAASAIKRNNEIKDYGKLIPGHGGIMDRFDSIIFTAPIVYYCLTFMTCG